MSARNRSLIWGGGFVVLCLLVYLLRDVLAPFVAGAAVAYLLDPVCDWLERKGFGRTAATAVVTVCFFLIALAVLALFLPLLIGEVTDLLRRLPDIIQALQNKAAPIIEFARQYLEHEDINIASQVGSITGNAVQWIGKAVGGVAGGFGAVFGFLSFMFITPVVAFYLLRDWDRMIATIDDLLPLNQRDTVREQATEIDRTLAGFVRGQASVCLLLGLFYGTGLAIVGLDFGFVIGLLTGFVSFIPYVGMLMGVAIGLGVAFAQFDSLLSIALVGGVFAAGQILEGNVITPKLVGEKVGLHAVWIIFALMAGGALFGFVGVLLAVPVAAVVGVLVRFFIRRYRESPLYAHGAAGQDNRSDPSS